MPQDRTLEHHTTRYTTRQNPGTSHNSLHHKTEHWNSAQLDTPQDRTLEGHTTRYTTRQNTGTSHNSLRHKTERWNITQLVMPQDRTLERSSDTQHL